MICGMKYSKSLEFSVFSVMNLIQYEHVFI